MIQKEFIKNLPLDKLVTRNTDSSILDLSVKAEEGIKVSFSCGHILIVSKDVLNDMKSDIKGQVTYLGSNLYCVTL